MQLLVYIIFQLDEARRYIQDGRLEHIRLALLILDNAAEVQLNRRIDSDLAHEKMRERLRDQVLQIPEAKRSNSLQELVDWKPLTGTQKRRIERDFNEKLNFLVDRSKCLDARLAEPLRYLHQYRNEAYHRGKVRIETVHTAAVILFEVNCQLLLSLPYRIAYWSSGEDYSWLEERFGRRVGSSWSHLKELEEVLDKLRSGILPTDQAVAAILGRHLESRIEDLYAELDFIKDGLIGPLDREGAIKESQYVSEFKDGRTKAVCPRNEFVGTYTIRSVEDIHDQLRQIGEAVGRLDAFSRFAQLERELEKIESPVEQLASEVDQMIQLQIDIARGK